MTDTPCSVDPAHGRADYGTSYGPLCADCYRYRVARQVDNEGYRTTSLDGVLSNKALIGIQPDGKRAPGAYPWWWCWGNQPVHVKGAVYMDSNEAAHLVKGITEAAAQRQYLAIVLATVPSSASGLTPRQLLRRAKRRHAR